MIDEANGGVVHPNFYSCLHEIGNKMYVDDFDNDMAILNIEEILLDSHMHDETSILTNFIEATSPILCFNGIFECVEERPSLRPSIEEHQYLSSSHYSTIYHILISVLMRLYR